MEINALNIIYEFKKYQIHLINHLWTFMYVEHLNTSCNDPYIQTYKI